MNEQLESIIQSISNISPEVKEDFLTRLESGKLLRESDPISHFCVYFVPIIPSAKKVFLGHHTKANSWIAPGGHIEPGHITPKDTVIQEAGEELGVAVNLSQISQPFFISACDVFAPNRECRRHYNVWYTVSFAHEETFTIEQREFYATKWFTFDEARKIVISSENLAALTILETM